MNEESDFDVLVSFQSGEITFDNYMDLKFYLEDLVCREVDLVTDDALKSRIQEQVLEQVEYAWKTDPAGVS